MRFFIPLMGAVSALSPLVVSAQEPTWIDTYEAGLQQAGETQKDLLITFMGSDWCDQCKILKETVLSKEEFIKGASANFVLVELDFPQLKPKLSERNEPVRAQFGVRGYPVLVTADSTGHPYGEVRYHRNWVTADYLAAIADQSANKATRDEARAEFENADDDEARKQALEKLLGAVPQTSIAQLYLEEFNQLRKVSKDKSPLVRDVVSKERVEKMQLDLKTLMGQRRYSEAVALCDDFLTHDNLSKGERQMGLTFKFYSQMELKSFGPAVKTAEALAEIDPDSPIGKQALSLKKRAEAALAAADKPKPVVPVKPKAEGPQVGEKKGEAGTAKTEAIKPLSARHKQTLMELEKVHAELAAAEAALAQAEADLAAAREKHEEAHRAETAARKMGEKKKKNDDAEAKQKEKASAEEPAAEVAIEEIEKNVSDLRKRAEEMRKSAEKLRQEAQE
ncbi:thioredoxin family protein [Roseibacillus persicicus]|uniref:thioredoxin family protein n=1 Tax=Roseibacillus persicicus TaxID=454148 RepID=UPI00280F0290|nr:thioredoxin family protein [Roseibacillus persicicus]MDQ8191314.1 thioredoxin family protein [Roseibacillus persicicus]